MSPVFTFDGTDLVNLATGDKTPVTPGAPMKVGALPLGTAIYPVPGDAIFVAPSGSNGNPGTMALPKATLSSAISAAPTGGTIVIRAGEYRENVGAFTKTDLTIQNYPGEAVWFDGSDVETSWTSEGGRWWAPLTVKLNHSVAHDGSTNIDRFVDVAKNPMAAWPDMVFRDGAPLWLVASMPATGQFSVDYTANRVWVADNPAGREMRVTKREKFLHSNAPRTTIRGIGYRRYGTPVAYAAAAMQFGSAATDALIENVHAHDIATQAMSINGDRSTVQDNTVIRPGMVGLHCNNPDVYTVRRNAIIDHNWKRFKTEPHSGGMKFTRIGAFEIEWNYVKSAPLGVAAGIWLDVYCWEGHISNNTIYGGRSQIFPELCGRTDVYSNWCFGDSTTYFNMRVMDSQECRTWNNYTDNAGGYCLATYQDNRQSDPSQKYWSLGLTARTFGNEFVNNYLGRHDLYQYYQRRDANSPAAVLFEDMATRYESNYHLSDPGTPAIAIRMVGFSNPTATNHNTVASFETAHAHATGTKLTALTTPSFEQLSVLTGAVPLPAVIAEAVGVEVGATRIGPFFPPISTIEVFA